MPEGWLASPLKSRVLTGTGELPVALLPLPLQWFGFGQTLTSQVAASRFGYVGGDRHPFRNPTHGLDPVPKAKMNFPYPHAYLRMPRGFPAAWSPPPWGGQHGRIQ